MTKYKRLIENPHTDATAYVIMNKKREFLMRTKKATSFSFSWTRELKRAKLFSRPNLLELALKYWREKMQDDGLYSCGVRLTLME